MKIQGFFQVPMKNLRFSRNPMPWKEKSKNSRISKFSRWRTNPEYTVKFAKAELCLNFLVAGPAPSTFFTNFDSFASNRIGRLIEPDCIKKRKIYFPFPRAHQQNRARRGISFKSVCTSAAALPIGRDRGVGGGGGGGGTAPSIFSKL